MPADLPHRTPALVRQTHPCHEHPPPQSKGTRQTVLARVRGVCTHLQHGATGALPMLRPWSLQSATERSSTRVFVQRFKDEKKIKASGKTSLQRRPGWRQLAIPVLGEGARICPRGPHSKPGRFCWQSLPDHAAPPQGVRMGPSCTSHPEFEDELKAHVVPDCFVTEQHLCEIDQWDCSLSTPDVHVRSQGNPHVGVPSSPE